ncbi:hypothetical protein CFP56_013406 [Quercus suber]|uniref:Uncharacterized protein n=1 Tax=Quercus suber TaxID=58331 RepID=A0AAW0KVW6_QUESU
MLRLCVVISHITNRSSLASAKHTHTPTLVNFLLNSDSLLSNIASNHGLAQYKSNSQLVNWPTDNLYELQGSKCASAWWDSIVSCPLDYILIETRSVGVCMYQTKVIEFLVIAIMLSALVTNQPNQFVMTQLMFQQQVHFMSAL